MKKGFFVAVLCAVMVSGSAYADGFHLKGAWTFSAPLIDGKTVLNSTANKGDIVYDISDNTFYGNNGSGSWTALDGGGASVPIGTILPFGGSTAPSGYMICDGSAISRTTYAALFAVLGTTYGAGDGSTTFNLPNLQGTFPRGAGSQVISGVTYGTTLGATQSDQMQGHVHTGAVTILSGSPALDASRWLTNMPISSWYAQALVNSGSPIDDGSNGTPRTGGETRPANVGVNYMIKL